MKKTTLTLAIALASIALLSTTANATPSAAAGDLIIGFQTTQTTGSTEDIEADLGAVSLFAGTTNGQSVNLTFGSSTSGFGNLDVADLSSVYGTDTNVKFAAATSNTTSDEVWITGLSGSTIALQPQNPGASTIGSLVAGFNTAAAGTNGSVVAGDTVEYLKSQGNSYGTIAGSSGTFSGQGTSKILNLASTSTPLTFDLYDEPQGSTGNATDLGTFTLNASADTLTFVGTGAEAVVAPEPSTYALVGAGLVLLVGLRRRMNVRA